MPTLSPHHLLIFTHVMHAPIETANVTAWVADGGRMVLCYVQGSGRRKRKKKVLVAVAEGRRTAEVEDGTAERLGYGIPESRDMFESDRIGLQVVLDSSPNLIR
ncbi:hypothetical protein Tco_1432623 [Tanacetum coccineum]